MAPQWLLALTKDETDMSGSSPPALTRLTRSPHGPQPEGRGGQAEQQGRSSKAAVQGGAAAGMQH